MARRKKGQRRPMPLALRKRAMVRRAGEGDIDYARRFWREYEQAVQEGVRMLCDWLGIDPREPQANEKLLAAMAREFIPYFRDAELVIGRTVLADSL